MNEINIVNHSSFLGTHGNIILIGFIGVVMAGALTSAVHNYLENKDIIKCTKLGIIGGAASGLVGIITYVLIELSKGGNI